MFQQYHLYSMDMSGDELLDSQPVLVPNTACISIRHWPIQVYTTVCWVGSPESKQKVWSIHNDDINGR